MRKVASVVGSLLLIAIVSWLRSGEPAAPAGASDARPSGARAPATAPRPSVHDSETTTRAETSRLRLVLDDITIKNYGRPHYRGEIDLTASVVRIQAGERFPHRNDGSVFGNRERLLPIKSRGYYREYVHPTPGLDGPGPQRLVVGQEGEWYYTPDHYDSFVRLDAGDSP